MKRILGLGQRCGLSSRRVSQLSTEKSSSAVEPEIVIPKRIPRGPTDILRALESTIHRDPTAPDYRYIDDPFLVPYSNFGKRSFALARESGRSAARYMMENFPECFKNDPAEPRIAQFNPGRPAFKEDQENSEEDLTLCIDELDVAQALIVYNNLGRKNVEITQETLLKLLQLVSFYNGKPALDSSLVEERYFTKHVLKETNTWEAGGVAEQIFEKIENKNAEAYSALTAGILKYADSTRGFKMYEEMRSKNLVPSLHVYNYLVRNSRSIVDETSAHKALLMKILTEMKNLGVEPDLMTFNNALYSVAKFGANMPLCSSILVEMEHLNIKPSLGTYYYLLLIAYRPRRVFNIMHEVMDRVCGQTWEVRDQADFRFLTRAMQVVAEYENDLEMAYRLLACAEENPHLMSNGFSIMVFFSNFFKVLSEAEDIDKLMLMYSRFVPNMCSLEPEIIVEILKSIGHARAYRYLSQIWSDIVMLQQVEREAVLKEVLVVAAEVERGTTKESQSLQDQCVAIARDIQTRVTEINESRKAKFRLPIVIDAMMISSLLRTFMNGDRLDFAADTLEYVSENSKTIPGVISADILMELAEKACEAQLKPMALALAKYSAEIVHDPIVAFIKEKAVELNFGDDFLRELESADA